MIKLGLNIITSPRCARFARTLSNIARRASGRIAGADAISLHLRDRRHSDRDAEGA